MVVQRGPALKFGLTQSMSFLFYNLRGSAYKQRFYCPAFGVLKPLGTTCDRTYFSRFILTGEAEKHPEVFSKMIEAFRHLIAV
jgi:hypothetical protein